MSGAPTTDPHAELFGKLDWWVKRANECLDRAETQLARVEELSDELDKAKKQLLKAKMQVVEEQGRAGFWQAAFCIAVITAVSLQLAIVLTGGAL